MSGSEFLIVRIAALGDVVLTTPLLNRIVAEAPGARITWLCGNRSESLVRLFPGVAEVITVDEIALLRGHFPERLREIARAWRQLARRRFDRILVVHADRRYRVLVWPLLGTPVAMLELGSNPVLGRFRGDEYARLLDTDGFRGPISTHYQLADVRPNLPRPRRLDASSKPIVALVPGGAHNVLRDDALRRWPVENYRELAARLLDAGCDVTLVGDEADRQALTGFSSLKVIDQVGKLTLVDSLCVLRDANVVVSHDTGPLHFARLVRTPVVALFGPTDPRSVVGEDDAIDALWGGAHLACRPCYDGRDYARCSNNLCMKDVSVDAVLNAVLRRVGLTPGQRTVLTSNTPRDSWSP